MIANPLDPQKAINAFDAWRDAQTDILNQLFTAWVPKPRPEASPTEEVAPESAEQPAASQPPDEAQAMAEEVARLKQQIAAIETKLDDMK